MNLACRACATILILLFCGGSGHTSELGDALTGGGAWLNLRYRTELADQENLPRTASAHTLRSRAGYASGIYRGLSAMAEYEYVFHIGAERFNNGNERGSPFPLVADPDTAELNQAALRYEGRLETTVILGRQRIVRDNERFIGDAGFRQNMQTFDAVSLINRTVPKTELRYEYIARANRIFGRESSFGDWEMDGHAAGAAWAGWAAGKLTGYGYLFDIDDRPDLSSQTYGVRWEAYGFDMQGWRFKYIAEAAWQSDYGNHRGGYDAEYYLLKPSLSNGPVTFTAGHEVLGAQGGTGFSTPLATLHRHQGFTDIFNTTPPDGVRDMMADINYQRTDILPFEIVGVWGGAHHFSAADGGNNYGQEYYLAGAVSYQGVTTEVKAAAYDAKGFSADTKKLWLSVAKNF